MSSYHGINEFSKDYQDLDRLVYKIIVSTHEDECCVDPLWSTGCQSMLRKTQNDITKKSDPSMLLPIKQSF